MRATMYQRKEEFMSIEERVAILETIAMNVNSTMLEIKNDIKDLSSNVDKKIDDLDKKWEKSLKKNSILLIKKSK